MAPHEFRPGRHAVTRRRMLTNTAAAAVGGVVGLRNTTMAAAQAGSAPAVQRGSPAGMPFRALVRRGTGIGVEDLRLRAITPRMVVVRTQAVAPCYTIVRGALATSAARRASVPNHCGFGVVEAVGAGVNRVQVGDRVVVAGTSQCGACYQCLHGRPDYCQFTFGGDDFPPFADMADGTPVYAEAGIGGISEIMAVYEEYCVPVFTDVAPRELTLLGDQLTSGFAAGQSYLRFEPGCDVAVFGVGPVGLGAVQAGRIMGAGQVIAIDPVKYRRDLAMKLGATTVLDPVAEGANLVERIRELCKGPTDRRFSGGMSWSNAPNAAMARGADFVIEAAGVQVFPPKVEAQPDPTNVSTVRQAWDSTRMGGHVMLMGLTLQEVAFPGVSLALLGRHIHPGQQGGLHMMRDIPRFVKLIEKGRLDAKSMITRTYSLAEARQAIQDTADRTIITGVVEFA
jgi:S-(hydroxymethyl)glutathione dehydrogenase/alcohol dehydrogenase